jgi:hypothetical protein
MDLSWGEPGLEASRGGHSAREGHDQILGYMDDGPTCPCRALLDGKNCHQSKYLSK